MTTNEIGRAEPTSNVRRPDQAAPCDCLSPEELADPAALARRRFLMKAAAAGTIAWVAPSIVAVSPAAAATSTPVISSGSSNLFKWNAAPPTVATVCSTGPSGNANRGSVVFEVDCSASPKTCTVKIQVNSGPALTGANAREVRLLQSNDAGTCGTQTSIGSFNSANGVEVAFPATNVDAATTYFAVVMLQTGGGGTDTYTTNRVRVVC